MSLNRTAFRLATILTLTNNYTAPFPTMAGERVFDSRIDPIEPAGMKSQIPILLVHTDDDDGAPLSDNNGGPPWRRQVKLVFQLVIGALAENPDTGLEFQPYMADAELEASLDLFEQQVRFALANTVNQWAGLLWSGFLIRLLDWSSQRWITADGGIRLAAREIMVTAEIQDDDLPEIVTGAVQEALPDNLQRLIDAVEADLDGDGNTKGHVEATINLLKLAGIPAQAQLDALKTITIREGAKEDDGVADIDAKIEGLEQ